MHNEISGVVDYKMPNDEVCLETIRSHISKLGATPKAGFDRIAPKLPKYDAKELYGLIPDDRSKPYDMQQILARIIDEGEFDEYKAGYGKTLITAYARIDGWAFGIVANQRSVVKTKKGEMQVGGVIYSESADKGARFILNCNQKMIPLVFFQDVTGFMGGNAFRAGRHNKRWRENGERCRETVSSRSLPLSSATVTAPGITRCAERRTIRGSFFPGPLRR